MTNTEEKMLEEYKAEMERHQQAIRDIMRKYNPDYNIEYDRRQRGDKMMCKNCIHKWTCKYINRIYGIDKVCRDFEEEKK